MRKINIYGHYFLLICIMTLFGTGCSHYVLPEAQSINTENIPNIRSTKTFRIVNNQPSKEKMKLLNFGVGGFYGTLHEFTNEAVRLSTEELRQRGVTFDDGGEKVIKLSITRVQALDRFVVNCFIDMDVETNSGYKATIKSNKVSPNAGQGLWGGAITNVIAELLRNEKFIAYLQE